MVNTAYILLFVWAMHGYATAREIGFLKLLSYPLLILPLFLDLITGTTQGYSTTFSLPAWQFMLVTTIAIGIIGISWLAGYGLGKLQGD